jgi:tetrapyrrole methylase family protein/MazG family protein
MASIKVVGLGPSGLSHISTGALEAIRSAPVVFVRTRRHPAVEELAAQGIRISALDYIYERSDTFEDVYAAIAERILEAGGEHANVVYAVPGHPLVGESSVRILLSEAKARGLEVEIVGSESFIEAALEALGLGLEAGLKVIDALSMDGVSPDPDVGNLIYQVYGRGAASEVKLKLMERYPDDFEVAMISGAGTPEETVRWIPLSRLDRYDCDHLTAVYIPPERPLP